MISMTSITVFRESEASSVSRDTVAAVGEGSEQKQRSNKSVSNKACCRSKAGPWTLSSCPCYRGHQKLSEMSVSRSSPERSEPMSS